MRRKQGIDLKRPRLLEGKDGPDTTWLPKKEGPREITEPKETIKRGLYLQTHQKLLYEKKKSV